MEQVLFWLFALVAVATALYVVTARVRWRGGSAFLISTQGPCTGRSLTLRCVTA